MKLWHLTPDTPRSPFRVSPGERVTIHVGTWPIETEQSVEIVYVVEHTDRTSESHIVDTAWQTNANGNSYWRAEIGPFDEGDLVNYYAQGHAPGSGAVTDAASFRVGPKLYLAVLWHQHQPIYKDTAHPTQTGSYRQPWVRLHAIRDYYSMAALVAEHPNLHLTINLTPALLWQIEDYTEHGATDRALDLTRKPAETLTGKEREAILSTFFDAHWHNQIFPHPRYKEMFAQRREGQTFTPQGLRDLQMWFNLVWFGQEFREGDVELVTGETVSVRRFVEQARNFGQSDVEAMLAEQYKVMRAVIPLHRQLQDQGQIEVATTPFYHPILPLLVDTDQATIDRPGASHPRRFAHPEDAEAQVHLAVEAYQRWFGRTPRGMWPAEGAVSQSVVSIFAHYGIEWIATDRGVLARSGRWGYDVDNPAVLCQPYRAEAGETAVSVFFRDTQLSDAIGFHYYDYPDYTQAARDFLGQIKERFARQLRDDADRVLTVVLDGENAWGAFREDARPFLHALYTLLEQDVEIRTVTFAEYMAGNAKRGVAAHPVTAQTQVYDLFTASWIDENGSALGVDLGTWIGEGEENRGWELLAEARDALTQTRATPDSHPAAYQSLYMAEGSDWFWWYGDDQDSGSDDEFDDLFRTHLKHVYGNVGIPTPAALDVHIVPHTLTWTFAQQIERIQPGDRLCVRTNCPGTLTWRLDDGDPHTEQMQPVGGVMAGLRRYQHTLGPFPQQARAVGFVFRCTHPGCDGQDICCEPREYTVQVG